MSRVMVIPDSRLDIEKIERGIRLAKKYNADKIILLGNYFDPLEGKSNLQDYEDMWDYLRFLIRKDTRVVPLLGERELSYMGFPEKLPGANKEFSKEIGARLAVNYKFMPCVAVDGVLYSSAGVTTTWLRRYRIMLENELRFRLGKDGGAGLIEAAILKLRDWDPFYDDTREDGSCMRADFTSLLTYAPSNIRQVVGTTMVAEPFNSGRIWFAWSEDENKYLYVNNGEPQVVSAEDDDSQLFVKGETKWKTKEKKLKAR